jgi:hypothetical protein
VSWCLGRTIFKGHFAWHDLDAIKQVAGHGSGPLPSWTQWNVKIDDAASGWLSKTAVLIAVAIVAEIVFAGSMLWHLVPDGLHNVQRVVLPADPPRWLHSSAARPALGPTKQ